VNFDHLENGVIVGVKGGFFTFVRGTKATIFFSSTNDNK